VDLLELQAILGHVSLLTTAKYTHLTNVTSRNTEQIINQVIGQFVLIGALSDDAPSGGYRTI
jgi:integrase/recombinase XerD